MINGFSTDRASVWMAVAMTDMTVANVAEVQFIAEFITDRRSVGFLQDVRNEVVLTCQKLHKHYSRMHEMFLFRLCNIQSITTSGEIALKYTYLAGRRSYSVER